MVPDITSPTAIFSIIRLILNIIVSGLVSNIGCIVGTSHHLYEYQFISAIVYGNLILNVTLLALYFTESQLDLKLQILISISGAILWLCAASLILHDVHSGICGDGAWYAQAMAAGILSLAIVIANGVEAFFLIKVVIREMN